MQHIKNFLKYKHLLKELVVRDIKVKYKRSVLGILWSVLNPLLTMIVITIVFSNLFRFEIENFPMYLITGQVLFNFFAESTNMAMISIYTNSQLIRKVYVPKYIFPLSKLLSTFVNLLFSLVAIIIVAIITKVKFKISIFFIIFSLIYLLLFSFGISLILSTITVFFRDVEHLYGVLLTAWMYLSAIFYPIDIIPEKYMIFFDYNPLYHIITHFRLALFYGEIPSFELNILCLKESLLLLIIGLIVFYKKQDKFILYI